MINDPLWVKQELEVKSGTTWNVFKLEVRDNADESVHKIPWKDFYSLTFNVAP